jgi:hypothetical protein
VRPNPWIYLRTNTTPPPNEVRFLFSFRLPTLSMFATVGGTQWFSRPIRRFPFSCSRLCLVMSTPDRLPDWLSHKAHVNRQTLLGGWECFCSNGAGSVRRDFRQALDQIPRTRRDLHQSAAQPGGGHGFKRPRRMALRTSPATLAAPIFSMMGTR